MATLLEGVGVLARYSRPIIRVLIAVALDHVGGDIQDIVARL